MKPYNHLPGYLHRWIITSVGRLAVRLHHIITPDNTPFLHTHPFSYCSVVVSGGYSEQVLLDGRVTEHLHFAPCVIFRQHTTPHRLTSVLPNTKTLFFAWSTIHKSEQGWELLRHPDVPQPKEYVAYPDGIYSHHNGFRKRLSGVWYALRPTINEAELCDRLSIHQHIKQGDINALDSSREYV